MGKFFDDTVQGLLEAVEVEKGNVPLTERKGMSTSTVAKKLVDDLIEIRKKENISQEELAKMTGSSQQSISRLEKQTHSPSLKLFTNIVQALGYELKLVKQNS